MLLSEIQAFLAVVRTGSFTSAARQLGAPKATLSRQVTRLEDRIGARLLARSTRKVALTEVGSEFYARCSAAVEDLEEAERVAAGMESTASGKLRVSTSYELAHDHLVALLPEFHARYPAVEVALDVTNRHVDLVGENYDVAVRGGWIRQQGLIARRVVDSEIGLFAARGYFERRRRLREWSELAEHELVALGPRANGRMFSLCGPDGEVELPKQPWLYATSPGVVKAAVLAELGIGLCVLDPFTPLFEAGELVRVLPQYRLQAPDAGGLFIVYQSKRHLTPKVRVFVDFMAERLPRSMGGKPARGRAK